MSQKTRSSKKTKKIPLSQGKFAIVDADDYAWLAQWKWSYNKGYAIRNKYSERVGGKVRAEGIRMHREILSAPKGMQVDHVDGNGLNNTRENLRICSSQQNNRNRKAVEGTSKFKGVTVYCPGEKWFAQIWVNKKSIFLGYFKDEKEAARAYNEAAKKHFGEFARLNEV